jgi:hypothetical protein
MSLKAKFIQGQTRKGNPSIAWYKQERGGTCPDDDKKPIQASYWAEFGCNKCDPTQQVEEQATKAEQCATERMANMKYSGVTPDKGHVYPIQLAYGIGKLCSRCNSHRLKEPFWENKFSRYYTEFVQDRPNINALFQGDIKKYKPELNAALNSVRKRSSIMTVKNPIKPTADANGWITVKRGGKRLTRKFRRNY